MGYRISTAKRAISLHGGGQGSNSQISLEPTHPHINVLVVFLHFYEGVTQAAQAVIDHVYRHNQAAARSPEAAGINRI